MREKISRFSILFRRKIKSKSGESIAETLVTMIILSLAVLMLAGAVVTSARVNKQADNTDTAFSVKDGVTKTSGTVTITDGSQDGTDSTTTISVEFYTTSNEYQYYDTKKN